MHRTTPILIAALWLTLLLLALNGSVQAGPGPEFAAGSAGAAPISQTHQLFLPAIASDHPVLRLSALYYDAIVAYEPDEAFQVWNISDHPANLRGYQVSDGSRAAIFPSMTLSSGAGLWCSGHAITFSLTFGFLPACEYGSTDSDPAVPDMDGASLRFGNNGGQARLLNQAGDLLDVLVYEGGEPEQAGWQGQTVQPYAPSNSFPAEGQILYRKFDWQSGQPWPDSDRAADWAQDPADPFDGQRVQYPGWDLLDLARPGVITATGTLTLALAPDNLYQVVSRTLASARQSIRLISYSFEHIPLAQLLATKASSGVSVTLLLEGSPVGGIADQERYAAQLIEAGGGQVWFMVSDRNDVSHDRYANLHAKYAIIDERLALISSENFVHDSMPFDDKSDGTAGRRGSALVSDSPELVASALRLFRADFDPANHLDLFRWTPGDPKYGSPPDGFSPNLTSGGNVYTLVQPQALRLAGPFSAEIVQSPETSLVPASEGGLLGLVERAGAGDTLLVQQLYERVHWGASSDTAGTAPNWRLAAYIAAARRGAQVRILLDAYFDHGDNAETQSYVNQLARAEGLDLVVLLGNPTSGGIHNKMVLVQAGDQGWLHLGSINGSEASAKLNRELAVQVESRAASDYLAAAFWQDWLLSGGSR